MSWQGQVRERTLGNVQDFWNDKAEGFAETHGAMMRDHYYLLSEINLFSSMVQGGSVLEAGCGAGWATPFYAAAAKHVIGFDITKGLIDRARRMMWDSAFRWSQCWAGLTPWGAPPIRHNIKFEVRDVLDLPYADNSFDAVICQRLLINLPTFALQRKALANLVRVLAPGGRLMLSEVTEDGRARMNALRGAFDLEPLASYWHNCYLHRGPFLQAMAELPLAVFEPACLEVYQFLSKVIYPAMIAPEAPRFMSPFNLAAATVSLFYPTAASLDMGLGVFLDQVFRGTLSTYWPDLQWMDAYDCVLDKACGMDIANCGHQTMYVARKEQ